MTITEKLQIWYNFNKRDLPWRNGSNPYEIWVSEVVLQQTQVKQGINYYLKIINNYPDIKSLANAREDEFMKIWQGLGYYSRALNMLATAKEIYTNYKSNFPQTYDGLIKLKGIGAYTATAILSIAFNKPYAVVDGNVYRVLSRYYGIELPVDSTAGKKEFTKLANQIMDISNPGIHNQSIMEFGAINCTYKSPKCETCLLNSECFAFINKCQDKLPVKQKSTKVTNRYFHYFIVKKGTYTYIRKRDGKDIWKSLYEFPLLEVEKSMKPEMILADRRFQKLLNVPNLKIKSFSELFKHQLSHQRIICRFYILHTKDDIPGFLKIEINSLNNYAFPKLIDNYILRIL